MRNALRRRHEILNPLLTLNDRKYFFRLIDDANLCYAVIVISRKTHKYVILEINVAVLMYSFTEKTIK